MLCIIAGVDNSCQKPRTQERARVVYYFATNIVKLWINADCHSSTSMNQLAFHPHSF